MAIQKRFIHFKKFSDFNSKKLSANEANTQYTVGVSGAIQDGEPDILYQSYVWIKDTKQQWTHAQLYGNDSTVDLTYEELKSLRDNAQLIPGQQYRITDYMTTTTQAGTAAAGHQFDIIVTSKSENELFEYAKADYHEGDTYFLNSNLSAWELKYTLDNDTSKYAWADATNGKGVIYYMKDEWNNECPYDFKNILISTYIFDKKNQRISVRTCLDNTNVYTKSHDYTLPQYCYTFCHYEKDDSDGNLHDVGDYSIYRFGRCMNNVIWEYKTASKQYINKLILAQRVGFNHDGFYNNNFLSSSDSIINVTWSSGAHDNNVMLNKSYLGTLARSQGSFYYSYIRQVYDSIDISCNTVYADNISGCNIILQNIEVNILNNCSGAVSYLYGYDFKNCSFGGCRNIYVCESFQYHKQIDTDYDETYERVVYEVGKLLDLEDVKFGSNIRDLVLLGNKYFYYYNYPCIIDNNVRSTDKVNLLDSTSDTGTRTVYIPKQIHVSTYKDEGRYSSDKQKTLHVPTYHISQSTSGDIIMTTVDDVINNVNTVSTTYEELVNLRDAAKLIPGCAYRITDYQTIIDDINATSALHQFDIIVTALDKQTLSEKASAIQHSGDRYFTDSKLNSWKIWYSLDNDKSRFAWASVGEVTGGDDSKFTAFYWNDPTSGEEYDAVSNSEDLICDYGTEYDDILEKDNIVIYKTKISYYLSEGADYQDKWFYRGEITVDGNTYDSWQKWDMEWNGFYNKDGNALFALTNRIVNQDGSVSLPQISRKEPGKGVIYRMIDEFGNDCPYDFKNIQFDDCYTFYNPQKGTDMSLTIAGNCHNNIIKPDTNGEKQLVLNDIVFLFDSHCYNNVCDLDCTRIHIGTNNTQCVIYDNHFHSSCQDINIDSPFICRNYFGYGNHNHTFQALTIQNNRFGIGVYNIEYCCTTIYQNTIGDYSHNFDIRVSLENTTIGNNTQYFYVCGGRGSYKNVTIGDCCDGVILDAGVYARDEIKIGCHCHDITISDGSSIVIGNNSHNITLNGDTHTIGNYCSHIDFSNMGVSSGAIGNTVGDNCSCIGTKKHVIQHCVFGSSCSTINYRNDQSCTIKFVTFGNSVRQIQISTTRSDVNRLFVASGDYNFQMYQNISDTIKKISIDDIAKVTYNELVGLRNNAQLVPGQKYRIIDYVTTTSQKDTTSAGHQFDIIVTANSPSILSEYAKVDQTKNDAYFDDKNLNAWEIKYCIDNDTKRFAWAGDELVQTTRVEAVNSSNCTISVGYSYDEEEGLNKFDERIHFISQMWEDPTNDPYVEGDEIGELITHWGYEDDPYGIGDCLTLYGLNLEIDEETGEITSEDGLSSDRWYYRGVITVDDTDYDYWESAADGYYLDQTGDIDRKMYFLTDRIVSGEPTIETITQEIVIPLKPKGVIYYMKDEHDNEAPYDFKNIQFRRCKVTSDLEGADLTPLAQAYVGYSLSGYGASMPLHISLVDESDYKYVYTFSCVNNGSIVDASLGVSGIACYDNSMKPYIASNVQYLNDIVMYAHPESGNHCITKNTFASDCFSMTLGCEQVGEVWDNHFGQYCKNNIILGPYVYQNDFGANLTACYFSQQISMNQIGSYMQRNFINNVFVQNVLGPSCKDNIFMKKCSLNTIGEQFMNNTCNDEFCQNNLGSGFLENTFNGKFNSNVSYNQFMRNTINGQCSCCVFETQCTGNTLGIFRNSKVGSLFMSNVLCDTMACVFGIGFNCNNVTATKMQCSTFGTYVMYNNWTSSGNVKNIKVSDYLQGTTSSYNNIELPADSVCEVKVAKNSSGDIKIYCEADLIS